MPLPMNQATKLQSLAQFLGVSQEVPADDHDEQDLAVAQLTVQDFCRGVLASREYRQSVLDRIVLGTLPSAVELRMYDYAHGKPVEHFEVRDKSDFLDLEPKQVQQRLERVQHMLQILQESRDAEDSDPPAKGMSVH